MALGVTRDPIRDTRDRLVKQGKICVDKSGRQHIYSLPNDLAEPLENNALGEISGEINNTPNDLAETPRRNLAALAPSTILDSEPTATGTLSSLPRRNAASLIAANGEVTREPTEDPYGDNDLLGHIDHPHYDKGTGL